MTSQPPYFCFFSLGSALQSRRQNHPPLLVPHLPSQRHQSLGATFRVSFIVHTEYVFRKSIFRLLHMKPYSLRRGGLHITCESPIQPSDSHCPSRYAQSATINLNKSFNPFPSLTPVLRRSTINYTNRVERAGSRTFRQDFSPLYTGVM
jgi:hypothetical protein